MHATESLIDMFSKKTSEDGTTDITRERQTVMFFRRFLDECEGYNYVFSRKFMTIIS